MAQFCVLAGVRGNAEALAAVLAALARRHVTRLLCAGDIVGYNADPAECAAALRERRVTPVCGRDDLIAVRRMGFDGCSAAEVHSLKRTRRSLTPEAAAWLRTLPTHQVVDGAIALVHAGVRDIGDPMSGPERIRENAAHLRYDFPGAKLCFFGRGAAPLAWEVDGNVVRALPAGGSLALDRGRMHFIHPGCVDAQGRRGAARVAEFAIFDTLEWTVEFARVPYDAASTEAKAAVFGYRMTALAAGLQALQRRLLRIPAAPAHQDLMAPSRMGSAPTSTSVR